MYGVFKIEPDGTLRLSAQFNSESEAKDFVRSGSRFVILYIHD